MFKRKKRGREKKRVNDEMWRRGITLMNEMNLKLAVEQWSRVPSVV